MRDTETSVNVIGGLYTEALLERLRATLVQRVGPEWTDHHVRRLAAALYEQQVGLVDLTRRQALIDEQVYGAALYRLRKVEQRLAEFGRHQPTIEMTAADLGGEV